MRYINLYEDFEFNDDDFDFEEETQLDISYCINLQKNREYAYQYKSAKIIHIRGRIVFKDFVKYLKDNNIISGFDTTWQNCIAGHSKIYFIIYSNKKMYYINRPYDTNEVIELDYNNGDMTLITKEGNIEL